MPTVTMTFEYTDEAERFALGQAVARGATAAAADWDRRDLPRPSIRAVIAAIEEASAFGERLEGAARRALRGTVCVGRRPRRERPLEQLIAKIQRGAHCS